VDSDFWLQRWQQAEIGFHQANTNSKLQQHWPALGLAPGSTVFVPLCGKSLDMVWLAARGHQVIGIELSQIAIDEFFAGLDLAPETRTEPGFVVKSAGPYELWCGDFFAMPAAATSTMAAIYDRASLIALPPAMRQRYAEKLISLAGDAAGTVQTLLITLEYDQSVLAGPPHSVMSDEVRALFGREFSIREAGRGQTAALSPKFKAHGIETVGEAVYIMTTDAARPA
jgi:thiopurine S-methyltransferase